MKLVQTVYILQKDQYEQSRKPEQELTTTSKKAHIRIRHPTSPAPQPTQKEVNKEKIYWKGRGLEISKEEIDYLKSKEVEKK